MDSLRYYFYDLYLCSSAGVGNIVRRINSNGYILSLINDYDFEVRTYSNLETADVIPSQTDIIENYLRHYLISNRFTDSDIQICIEEFYNGYDLYGGLIA